MEDENEKTPMQKIDELYEFIKGNPKIMKEKKPKEFKIPAKGKVSKAKMAKGYAIIEKINENRAVSFEKQKVEMEVYKTADGIYHSSDGRELLSYKGKPLYIQPGWRQNPIMPFSLDGVKDNNVYGQKPILAAMQTGIYTGEVKKKGGMKGIIWIIVIAVAGYLAYSLITKGHL